MLLCLEPEFGFIRSGVELRIFISNKFLGVADAAIPQEPLIYSIVQGKLALLQFPCVRIMLRLLTFPHLNTDIIFLSQKHKNKGRNGKGRDEYI